MFDPCLPLFWISITLLPARLLHALRLAPPKHHCAETGGSRKGVPGLEQSEKAGTPFLKARRRAKSTPRVGSRVLSKVFSLKENS